MTECGSALLIRAFICLSKFNLCYKLSNWPTPSPHQAFLDLSGQLHVRVCSPPPSPRGDAPICLSTGLRTQSLACELVRLWDGVRYGMRSPKCCSLLYWLLCFQTVKSIFCCLCRSPLGFGPRLKMYTWGCQLSASKWEEPSPSFTREVGSNWSL